MQGREGKKKAIPYHEKVRRWGMENRIVGVKGGWTMEFGELQRSSEAQEIGIYFDMP